MRRSLYSDFGCLDAVFNQSSQYDVIKNNICFCFPGKKSFTLFLMIFHRKSIYKAVLSWKIFDEFPLLGHAFATVFLNRLVRKYNFVTALFLYIHSYGYPSFRRPRHLRDIRNNQKCFPILLAVFAINEINYFQKKKLRKNDTFPFSLASEVDRPKWPIVNSKIIFMGSILN